MPAKKTRPDRHGAEGAVYRRIVQYVVSRDYGICHVCGHPGANSADHHPHPVTERPDLARDPANLRAIHGHPSACPVCSPAAIARGGKPVYCNEIKQALSLERARRIIETRTGLSLAKEEQPRGEREWLERPAHRLRAPRAVVQVVRARAHVLALVEPSRAVPPVNCLRQL